MADRPIELKSSYHHGDLRGALLDAGDQVLHDIGLQAFTLRECARRAGVSHAAPKHHFGGVQGLLTALAARGFERLTIALRKHLKKAGCDLDAQFVATSTAYTQFAKTYPQHFRVMFRCDLLDMQSGPLRLAMDATFVELTNVIRRQRGEVEISAAEFPVASLKSHALLGDILVAWCFIHGYAHLLLESQLLDMPDAQQHRLRTETAQRLGRLIRSEAESGKST